MRHRHRRGRKFVNDVKIVDNILKIEFIPFPSQKNEEVEIYIDELQVAKLIAIDKKTQEEVSDILGCSRQKVQRLYSSFKEKIVKALVEGLRIRIVERDM